MIAALVLVALVLAAPAQAGRQPLRPLATVVMIPGSGFNGATTDYVERMSFRVDVWRRAGFRTKVAAYPRGRAGLVDVTRTVRRAAAETPGLPLCVYGESSGGTWALQVTARTGLVDCAVVLAAPTDQETLARSPHRLARHLGGTMWPRYFGPADGDDAFEPFDTWATEPPAVPVLLGYAEDDEIVPAQQGELLAPLSEAVELRVLRRGRHQFVHSRVDAAQFVSARRAALALVAAQTTSP